MLSTASRCSSPSSSVRYSVRVTLRPPLRSAKKKSSSMSILALRGLRLAVAACHEHHPLEQVHVLLVFEQRAVQRRQQLAVAVLAQGFRRQVFRHQQLEPVQQLGGGGLLLEPRYLTQLEEHLQRFLEQLLLEPRVVDLDDLRHGLLVREADVMEEAAAQEGVRQLLFV